MRGFAKRIRISNVIFYSSLKSYDKIIFFEENVTFLVSLATLPAAHFNQPNVYKIKDLRVVYISVKVFYLMEK